MGLDYNEYTSLHFEARSYRYGSYWNIKQYLLLVTNPVLHIHSVVEECEIMELLEQIDPRTNKPMKKKIIFVKTGAVVVLRYTIFFRA